MNNGGWFRFILLVVCFTASAFVRASIEPTADGSEHLKGQAWENSCRQRGFDPWQLACQTCDLLPSSVVADCRDCCQPYKDTQSLRKPYQSAVLVVPQQQQSQNAVMDSELEMVLREDWDDLVQKLGGSTRLQKISVTVDGDQFINNFWMVRAPPAEVHFLEERLPAVSSSTRLSKTMIADKAKETITLYGWKRDDIRDMIQTLLG